MSISSNVTPREPARNGSEQDVISRFWRGVTAWTDRAGATSYYKRAIRRRERQAAKKEIRDHAAEA